MCPKLPTAVPRRCRRRFEGHIQLRGLRYTYPGASAEVLTGIDLDIAEGETLAVLGRVGAGKTTLLRCFVRLLDPPAGSLLIDGCDVRDFPLSQLRHQVVLVPQDPFLFADLLRHNLSYDNPERDDALIWSAASDADLRDTIVAFADALDTPVGGTRRDVVGRTEAALDADARPDSNAAGADPRRLLFERRHRNGRTHPAAPAQRAPGHDDHPGFAPCFDRAPCRQNHRARRRRHLGNRQPRRVDRAGRLVRGTRADAAPSRPVAVAAARSGGGRLMSASQRDYAVFDAELAGKSFNARLIARLLVWVRPHWRQAAISGLWCSLRRCWRF